MTDEHIRLLRKRNDERLKVAIQELGARYCLSTTRPPTEKGQPQ